MKKLLIFFFLIAVLTSTVERSEGNDSYLLLVSFSAWNFSKTNHEKLILLNSLPYDGLALPIINAYDEHIPLGYEYVPIIEMIKSKSRKDIWPWIFLNRIVGNSQHKNRNANKEYFTSFNGLDLYDNNKALTHFFNALDKALIIAKSIDGPGIFFDPEFYNSNENYYLDRLETLMGIDKIKLVKDLRNLGAKIADHIHAHYPKAIIWTTFTGLGHKKPTLIGSAFIQWRTVTWIFDGMLARAKEKAYKFSLLSGAEWSLGYCYINLEDARRKIDKRQKVFAPYLSKYPNLKLAGSVAPWGDSSLRKGYFGTGPRAFSTCRKSKLTKGEEFIPIIQELMSVYHHVWVYASSGVRFFPFRESGKELNEIVKLAK